MDKEKRSRIKKNILFFVSVTVFLFIGAGALLGLRSANEMRKIVGNQFNAEQLVIAQNVANRVEKEINYIEKEIYLLNQDVSAGPFDPKAQYDSIRKSFSRVLERGVKQIELVDLTNRKAYIYGPFSSWSVKEPLDTKLYELPFTKEPGDKRVWISQPQVKSSGIHLGLASSLIGDPTKQLRFNVTISWLLTPFLKNIRSGKTGYAWIIDENGIFLFHPDATFIGKSAFKAREEKLPGLPYEKINFIQREKMLRGEKGLGSYYSGWHRGITGKIEKLIAYYPIVISEDFPQKWSVAVVAPISEIEEAVKKMSIWQFFLQGLIIIVIVLAALAVLFFEMRRSRQLEEKVDQRTEELKKSEEKYRSLVESAEDLIFTVDSENIFLSMNNFTANFFGGRPEDLIGKSVSELFPKERAEKQLEIVKMVYQSGKSMPDEFKLDIGEYQIWFNASFMPLRDEKGKVSQVLCIARDITEYKNLERHLINTEKLASIGTLAAGVAHEINNPLGVILGFCDLLLRKTPEDTQAFEDLKTIERQGLHCKQVVENLLSFARVEEGIAEYSDLNHCLEEIIQIVRHNMEMNDIELITDFAERIPLVKGEPRQLQQVFLNLINNAIASMEGGGTLLIHTHLERGGRKAVASFQDNGIGIDEENIDHIFEPFFTTKPEGEGTGMGLFVSYGIVSKYGGSIVCTSHTADSPGKSSGTLFTVTLLTKT
ncbi:MAG: PAS domain S-box protein [Deltaproteobacteria bacterium]|nr:PAS domain S-box protein [Deltaproteobacteria bacterium]MBW2139820.1 PAS domain S-box protein [Deltaproteobacteria bacterium]MBW2322170.1 PAS domain S-box protein [Deltaproteobacteria bacterium]